MAILLKTTLVRVSSIQIMQIRVQNKGKRVWKVDTMETYQLRTHPGAREVNQVLASYFREKGNILRI